jgi:hypothetical protein
LKKKELAFLLGITKELAFAAGNIALSLHRYMAGVDYELVIYYKDLDPADHVVLESLPKTVLRQFWFEQDFVDHILKHVSPHSRVSSINDLMAFCHFEAFDLLDSYRNVAWLDVDISIQANLQDIVNFGPLGITSDDTWTVQKNFLTNIEGYDMSLPGVCSAVMVVSETLPYRAIYEWCYDKARELVSQLRNRDQGIINLALQKFGIIPSLMPLKEWQCIYWRDEAITAKIVHFGEARKVWFDFVVCCSFPEWYRVHRLWVSMGGSNWPPGIAKEPVNIFAIAEQNGSEADPGRSISLSERQIFESELQVMQYERGQALNELAFVRETLSSVYASRSWRLSRLLAQTARSLAPSDRVRQYFLYPVRNVWESLKKLFTLLLASVVRRGRA